MAIQENSLCMKQIKTQIMVLQIINIDFFVDGTKYENLKHLTLDQIEKAS